MNKKNIIIFVLVIVVLGGYFLMKNQETQAPTIKTSPTSNSTEKNINNSILPPVQKDDSTLPPIQVITYTDTGYSPSTLTVKLGEAVVWRNDSSRAMWPASAFHPTHTAYPTTGGCLGSTFDACKGIQPGDFWSFKFEKVGTWKYHDHLKPNYFGTIVVE